MGTNMNTYIPPRWYLFLQIVWKRLSSKEIGIVDVFIICLTIITLTILHWTKQPTLMMLLWRWIFMLPVLCLTALLNNNYENYNRKFTHAYLIVTSNMALDDKMDALKKHLNTITKAWNKYHRQLQIIVEGKEELGRKMVMLGDLVHQIMIGKISVPQGIYITVHSFYSIIISSNLLMIPDPYDVMINLVFMIILRYAGAEMKGLGELLNDFFMVLKPGQTDLEIEQGLIDLGDKMKEGCYADFILTSNDPVSLPCPLEGQVKDIDGMKVKINGTTFTEKEMDLIVAKEISDGLGDAKKEMDAKKVELIKEITVENAEKKK